MHTPILFVRSMGTSKDVIFRTWTKIVIVLNQLCATDPIRGREEGGMSEEGRREGGGRKEGGARCGGGGGRG